MFFDSVHLNEIAINQCMSFHPVKMHHYVNWWNKNYWFHFVPFLFVSSIVDGIVCVKRKEPFYHCLFNLPKIPGLNGYSIVLYGTNNNLWVAPGIVQGMFGRLNILMLLFRGKISISFVYPFVCFFFRSSSNDRIKPIINQLITEQQNKWIIVCGVCVDS